MAGSGRNNRKKIKEIYDLLDNSFGDLKWWPAESDFEVIIGAVLTQNTSWTNVEITISRLKSEKLLTPSSIVEVNINRLAGLIRSSGYFRVKSRRLKYVCRFILDECNGRLEDLKKIDTGVLRSKLLSVNGIGPETADSILLYALKKPVFVVDSYTKRIFSRHRIIKTDCTYDEVQSLVHENFPLKVQAMNQFHALIVETAKRFCKKNKPLCEECPLNILFIKEGKKWKI